MRRNDDPRFARLRFGAAYYAEYQPAGTLDADLDLMRDAGFSVIRVGESVWSTWEPRDGEFDLEWLQPVLDGAHARGIGVVLGTPTYAVPPWLANAHPEIAAETATGRRVPWGSRQEADQSHPVHRRYAERVVRQVVGRWAAHPAVIGFQVDNEPGLLLPHNDELFARFVDRLRERYGDVATLNEAWGLVYWSHRIDAWAELWRPDGNAQPQYDLEWRRFQAEQATELIAWQARVVRELARDDQFVTTCIAYARPQVDDDALVRSLDVTAGNPYYAMQDGLDVAVEPTGGAGWWHTGVASLVRWADRAYASRQAPFLVTETNAQTIGGSWQNRPPYPGQLRQAALLLVARGARMIEYWHWHTLHFGAETYWGGVLPHSGLPGRVHREVAALGASLAAVGPVLEGFVPHADVAVLWSNESRWALEFQPPLADAAGGPDRDSYERIVDAFHRGLVETGAQTRIVHVGQLLALEPEALVARHPVLVAAAAYVASDALLEHLRRYVRAGGHLVLGIRTAYADELARARREVAPPRLADLAGVRFDEYTNLSLPMAVTGSAALPLEPGAAATAWLDVLEVDDAEVLVTLDDDRFGSRAAVTSRASGPGRVTTVATVPDPALARGIARFVAHGGRLAAWQAADPVRLSSGMNGAGVEVVFASNWSGATASVTAPVAVRDAETGAVVDAGDALVLPPRGAVVLEVLGGEAGSGSLG